MLTAQSAIPQTILRPFIHCYVQRDTPSNQVEIIEPVIPRAGSMLEFQFAAVYEVRAYGTEALRTSWAATIIGPIDSLKVRLLLRGEVRSLAVLFRPLGLYRFFGTPVSPLTGVGTEGDAVFGSTVSSLYERLGNTPDFATRAKMLDSFFLDRLQQSAPLNSAALAIRQLASVRRNVKTAAQMAGIGERQLERKALELVGMPLRNFLRISRFQHAIAKHQSGFGSWMEIAHEVGYYDQMHLIRNFHALAGGAPTDVMKQIADHHLISYCSKTAN